MSRDLWPCMKRSIVREDASPSPEGIPSFCPPFMAPEMLVTNAGVEPSRACGWTNVKKGQERHDVGLPTLHEYVGHHPQLQPQGEAGQRCFIVFYEKAQVTKKDSGRICRDKEIEMRCGKGSNAAGTSSGLNCRKSTHAD